MGKNKAITLLLLFSLSCVERISVVDNPPPRFPKGDTGGLWVLTTLSPELWYISDTAFKVLTAGLWANDLTRFGDTLAVVNSGDNNVYLYTLTDGSLDTLHVGSGKNPWAAVYDRRTGRLFVSNFLGNSVSVFEGGELKGEIDVGPNPEGMVVVGDVLYVACTGYGDGYRSRIYTVSTDELRVMDSLFVGLNVQVLTSDPEGDVYALATGDYSSREGWIYRLREGEVVDSLFIGGWPGDMCLSSDGKLYITGWNGGLWVYDWAVERLEKALKLSFNIMACGFKGDTLSVADFSNDRVLLLDGDGKVVSAFYVGDGPIDLLPDVR